MRPRVGVRDGGVGVDRVGNTQRGALLFALKINAPYAPLCAEIKPIGMTVSNTVGVIMGPFIYYLKPAPAWKRKCGKFARLGPD